MQTFRKERYEKIRKKTEKEISSTSVAEIAVRPWSGTTRPL
jgi:hypothetical protein